jgi:hypothetical protein
VALLWSSPVFLFRKDPSMAGLFGLAKNALRRILGRRSVIRATPVTRLESLVKAELADPTPPPVANDDGRSRLGPPVPIVSAPQTAPTQRELNDVRQVQETYDDIQQLGRDQGHDEGGIDSVMAKMRQVSSSNVWGYYFELESSKSGLLYVTFLAEAPSGGKRPSSAGPTYVYFDVPTSKFEQFQAASESSAGRAVWDYLRVRGTSWQHQHRYRLAQVQGDYIPRKATRLGFQNRQLLDPSGKKIPNATWAAISRLERSKLRKIREYANKMKQLLLNEQGIRRSTLPPRTFLPNRGTPNRGRPNRGQP